jgi:hypothetical protein
MCSRWRFTWGRRRSNEDSDVPIAETGEHPSLGAVGNVVPAPVATFTRDPTNFKFMEIYHTEEEAIAITSVRRTKFIGLPEPMVARIREPSV